MSLFKKTNEFNIDKEFLPRHIGIIMDGNGRWAKNKGLPRTAGHVAGAKTFRKIVKHCEKRGIEVVTVYAFSTENWRRPQDEVDAIMNLFRQYLKESLEDFKKENIITRFIGDRTVLAQDIQDLMEDAEYSTSHKTGMILNIAINYGGRNEIVHSFKELYKDLSKQLISIEEIDEKAIEKKLYTASQPDVDLILRPSGEYRLSNFLIWQCAYAEYVFMDVLWPDFTSENLDQALLEYASRNRRFGGI